MRWENITISIKFWQTHDCISVCCGQTPRYTCFRTISEIHTNDVPVTREIFYYVFFGVDFYGKFYCKVFSLLFIALTNLWYFLFKLVSHPFCRSSIFEWFWLRFELSLFCYCEANWSSFFIFLIVFLIELNC